MTYDPLSYPFQFVYWRVVSLMSRASRNTRIGVLQGRTPAVSLRPATTRSCYRACKCAVVDCLLLQSCQRDLRKRQVTSFARPISDSERRDLMRLKHHGFTAVVDILSTSPLSDEVHYYEYSRLISPPVSGFLLIKPHPLPLQQQTQIWSNWQIVAALVAIGSIPDRRGLKSKPDQLVVWCYLLCRFACMHCTCMHR